MMLNKLCTRSWLLAYRRKHRLFSHALQRPQQTQTDLLLQILKANGDCAFGKRYVFDHIKSVEDFQQRIKLSTYEDCAESIDEICRGKVNVLTCEPVRRLVPTSGSSGAVKLIPWTDTLHRQFNAGIGPWMIDLYRQYPSLKNGQSYWSISPAFDAVDCHDSKIPIGFADDSEYLGRWLAWLVNRMMVVPNVVRHLSDMPSFQYVTMLLLLQAQNLKLISVWHPSFLSLLWDCFEHHREALCRDLHDGSLTPPGDLPVKIRAQLQGRISANPQRSRAVARGAIFPNLDVVSCWADGAAEKPADTLSGRLPGVAIEPKGLISTEAFVSLPWQGKHPLSIRSHFFEFMDDAGEMHLAHQLQPGCQYRVIVTTGGGLYRYQTYDLVEVDGVVEQTPSIRFVARDNCTSDLCGEKLNESFVASVIKQVLDFEYRFVMMGVDQSVEHRKTPGYILFLEAAGPIPEGLAEVFDRALAANLHYAYCRSLGQLMPLKIHRIACDGEAIVLQHLAKHNRVLGQIKPTVLNTAHDWQSVFGSHPTMVLSD